VNQHHHSLEIQFERFLQSAGLVRRGDSVVLAVSGGIDSMTMLHLFAGLAPQWNLKLVVAHVNHQLRGDESIGDETFVQKGAESLNIPFVLQRVDTVGLAHTAHISKQEAARELRYEFFEGVRRQRSADAVATAHQADDNAETVLLNALRGTGIRGLAGIPVRREPGKIIRPLITARRKEIEQYAREREIAFRLDSSNTSIEYRRNYLRREVIPLLESSGEFDFVPSFNRLSRLMRQLDELLTAEVRQILSGVLIQDEQGDLSLDITKLRLKPEYLQEGIVLEVLRKLGAEIDSEKVLRVLELCELTTGSALQLSKDLHVFRDRERLNFVRPSEGHPMHQEVALGNSYTFQDFRISLSLPISPPSTLGVTQGVEYVDAGKLGDHLLVRSWQDGDWFMPLGMISKKKVSDYFVDEKIPLLQKRTIPILESNGDIVWICGKRLDERFKVTDRTRSVVRLEIGPTIFSH
jgi:tRNA(Ile)-lysidine synthase